MENAKKLLDFSFLASVTLVKIRLLFDVMGLQSLVKKHPGANYEKKMEHLREYAMSDILVGRKDIVDRTNYEDLIGDLQDQVGKTYDLVKAENKYYWPALKSPEQYANKTPAIYSIGSEEEVILKFRETWYALSECPPAIELVRGYNGEWVNGA